MQSLETHLDFSKTLQDNTPPEAILPKRSQIYLGFKCSQQCGFCYYKSKCSQPILQFELVKKQVDLKLKYGIVDFELTGGEPGESPDLERACLYIKSKSPKSRIAVITNGAIVAHDEVFDLIDEVLVSYHLDKDASDYDEMMFPRGSTFAKVQKTIEKASQRNLLVRTNTVVGTFNLSHLSKILEDLVQLKPRIVNFLPVNIFDDASGMSRFIDYQQLRPRLKEAFIQLSEQLPTSLSFARYMPFCQLDGFQKHIVGYAQHVFDWFDWNVELGGTDILELLEKGVNQEDILMKLGRYGSKAFKFVQEARRIFYTKPAKCLMCKYNPICDGIEKSVDPGLIEEFAVPEIGAPIKNPVHFFGDQTHRLYQEVYQKDLGHHIKW